MVLYLDCRLKTRSPIMPKLFLKMLVSTKFQMGVTFFLCFSAPNSIKVARKWNLAIIRS